MKTEKRCFLGEGAVTAALLGLSAIIVVIVLSVVIVFAGELLTLASIECVDEETHLFTMEYKGNYGLNEFMETGASSDAGLVDFIVRRVLRGIPLEFDLPELGCSTFAAHLEDGTPIFGRNFDMYDSPGMLVTTRPKNGYASISMVNLAYIGYSAEHLPDSFSDRILTLAAPYVPLDGVNEKGLSVGVLMIDAESTNQQTDKVDVTTTSAIRLLLDRAATVEEAVALLESVDMHASAGSCYHFHIADAQGGSVVVEYIGSEMNVIESKMATNFLLTPGDWDFGSGQDRFAAMQSTMVQNGGVFENTTDAMKLLETVSQKPAQGKKSTTQWSCIYNQNTASVEIAMDMDYENVYTFSLNEE